VGPWPPAAGSQLDIYQFINQQADRWVAVARTCENFSSFHSGRLQLSEKAQVHPEKGRGWVLRKALQVSSISLSRVSKNGRQETKLINYNGHYAETQDTLVQIPQMHVIFKKPMVRPKASGALAMS